MAIDPRDIKKAQDLLDALEKVQKKVSEIKGEPVKFEFEGKSPEDLAKEFGGVDNAITKITSRLKETKGELNNVLDGTSEFASLTNAIASEFANLPTALKKSQNQFKKINGFAYQLTEISADLSNYSKQDVVNLKKKTDLEFKRASLNADNLANELKLAKEKLEDEEAYLSREQAGGKEASKLQQNKVNKQAQLVEEMEAALSASKDELGLIGEKDKAFNKVLGRVDQINKNLGITGATLKGAGKLVKKLGFSNLAEHFDKGAQAAKDLAAKIEEGDENLTAFQKRFPKTATMVKGLGVSLGGALKSIFTDPLTLLVSLGAAVVKAFKHVDHAIADTGKSLGLTRDAAAAMTKSVKDAAAASGDTFLNMDRLLQSQIEMSKELGTNVQLSAEQLQNTSRLRDLVGLQGAELKNVLTSSMLIGKSQEEMYNQVVDTNDTIFASNELFQEAASTTGQIAMNLGNNIGAIAQAAGQAKKLGINLETARDMAMGTLDFENSIAKEMEAQILTGKSINLNRARELAFAGDFTGAAKEMLNQVGGIGEFQEMNVLAQQALAESMGMTVDQLSDQIRQREIANKLAAREKELHDQGLTLEEAQLQALRENQTVGERLGNAFAKIGDKLGGLVLPLVEKVADGLESALSFFGGLFGGANKTADELKKMPEALAIATQQGEALKSKFSGVIDFVKGIGSYVGKMFDGLKGNETLTNILKVAGLVTGGALVFKGAKNLFQGKGLFGSKLGASASNPMFVTMGKGSNLASDITSSFTKTFKGKALKGLSTVMGGKSTMAGRALRGAAAKSMGAGVKTAAKGGAKAAGKGLAKAAGKSLLKKIPLVGALAGVGFGISRALKGDFTGAALEVASGLAGTLPGVGTAASVAIDAGLAARDVMGGSSRGPDTQTQPTPETVNASDVTLRTLPEDTLAFAGGTQFGKETNDLLRQLIAAVNQGGDVMLDGVKVGNTLSLSSYKL